MAYTTILVNKETKGRLAKLKSITKETYDELLTALMDIVPSGDDEGAYSEEFKASLLRAILDAKYGRIYSLQEIKARLGVK